HRPARFGGLRIGISLCEDAWFHHEFADGRRLYAVDPIAKLRRAGADCLVNISASPFTVGKSAVRRALFGRIARQWKRPVLYANLVGGNDELVFDGRSFAMNARGEVVAMAKAFAEDLLVVDLAALRRAAPLPRAAPPPAAEVHAALALGLRDYLAKCGFRSVLVGLSGGIDSALVAAIAAEALGPEAVRAVTMPSPYSGTASVRDAQALARNLGIRCDGIPIDGIYHAFRELLRPGSADAPPDVADENLQARIRGAILMTLSNRTGALVLSTGNKSELAVGYCTIYGDMVGGMALISDIPKTMVYALARWINRERIVIPEAILAKAPSAELRPHQTDQDTLPPYDVLDRILKAYIEDHAGIAAIARRGVPRAVVEDIVARIHRNEYKRRQAAPGIKITSKAFGMGRRFPIAAGHP
ncbi:MAG: NAD+ synthase, partial [Deltaproteobacteria bacterium]|nr:NAD+ synthase [Deltaproteobacteria bacterium]